MKRRYNYLSHLVDSSTDCVSRVAKISAFWASISQGVLVINLLLYLGAGEISAITVVLFSFLLWVSVFSVMIVTQLGWIAYIVDRGIDGDINPDDIPPHPAGTDVTKYYVFDGSRYKIDKVEEKASRGGEASTKKPNGDKVD